MERVLQLDPKIEPLRYGSTKHQIASHIRKHGFYIKPGVQSHLHCEIYHSLHEMTRTRTPEKKGIFFYNP